MKDNHAFLILGLCGILFYLLAAYRSLKTDAEKANLHLSFRTYIINDWPGHIMAMLPVVIWFFTFGEAVEKFPAMHNYARISFALVGALGSWGFQKLLSRSKRIINRVVDEKTDIADSK